MKNFIFFAILFNTFSFYSQTDSNVIDSSNVNYNRWTIELAAGQLKGVAPYADGYFSSNPGSLFGSIDVNSFSLATRYAFSPKFGIRFGVNYDLLSNLNKESLPFSMQQIGLSVQGVVNLNRLFSIENDLNRFGILLHGGLKVDQMTSKTQNTVSNRNYNKQELNGGLVFGVTPQYRITNRIAIFADVTVQSSYRQHFNWDGSFADLSGNNMKGQSVRTSFGLSISLGDNKVHGDWAVIETEAAKKAEAINSRIDEVETLMNDTDKDGVPDYIDQENNSVAGVAVDSRGKMVDINKNGVPDEIERYVNSKVSNEVSTSQQSSKSALQTLIDEKYVAVYFEPNKSVPSNVSSEGLNFIRTYLRSNPEDSVYVIGHADEIGDEVQNKKLSEARAIATREVLIKAGIAANRLIISSEGEDSSVDKDSKKARDLVRRVTFKIVK
jgi:OOP family OmpA-OmpF porin